MLSQQAPIVENSGSNHSPLISAFGRVLLCTCLDLCLIEKSGYFVFEVQLLRPNLIFSGCCFVIATGYIAQVRDHRVVDN
ncbi:hypothetical protein BO70DRAFT_155438 [Aspergillus heteromorphus CBS 117.55]|uniref:Uncharacterized protein n=1 Tax=Aspergillus heteromorphus CBS 117.55 TaxID=1448321 RepID=A0A317V7C7_9EURO|nr:uncharacterized protein BO70DRAFT_155438 [Aspergillus heteromorphus CBS 117.55]PWY68040.1 hypothetical protein BO70DRAFT_155438 [Aspergillus heteromorphus CBS 117.55]